MKQTSYYRLGVIIGGAVALAASILAYSFSMEYIGVGLATALFAALLGVFSIELLKVKTSLAHILGLGVGVFYNFPLSICAVAIGIIGGSMLRLKRDSTPYKLFFRDKEQWLELGFLIGSNLIPLALVWALRDWAGGMSGNLLFDAQALGKITLALVAFALTHTSLVIIDYFLHKSPKNKFFRRDLIFLGLLNFFPLPLVVITVQAYPAVQLGAFILFAGTLTSLEILMNAFLDARAQAERQLDELSTLNKISLAMQSTLSLDELLPIIHQQVTDFLENDSFYVALYDEDKNELWYPLAVKHDQPQDWPRRPIEDRLTDRVILEKESILLTPQYQQGSDYIGLPTSAETPHSWMGVPLITSERVLGCLAVMGFNPNVKFTTFDLNLLTTLSGQVSAAIENALLYANTDQALSRRVQQLAVLGRVGRELSAEFDLERLFDIILQSALNFTNTKRGGVLLLNEQTNQLELKMSEGYSLDFPEEPALVGIVGRVARTKQVQNVPDVRLDADYHELANGNTRSQLSVPMLHNERLLGIINVESEHVGAFSENDQAFISQLADQAAIALQSALLFSAATQERDRLDTVLDSVGEAILMIQSDGRTLLANEVIKTFTGTPLNKIIGVHFSELPDIVQTVLGENVGEVTPLNKIWSGKHHSWPINDTYKVQTPNLERVLNRGIFPVGRESEHTQGIVIVLRDITEEIRIREERELINETLVHDLRSPTSAALGALDIIESVIPDDENKDILSQSLNVAQRSTQRVLRLITTLLDISRLETGSLELILDYVSLVELVDDILPELIYQANRAGIIINNTLSDSLPFIWADADKLKRVIINLLDNAIKFTPEGGQVGISASLHGDEELLIQIYDTGPGIPVEYREKIFERFVQAPGIHGRRRGSGLGLTFCQLTVNAHGGKIWVDERLQDEHPQGGSIFKLTLPLEGPPPDEKLIMRRFG